MILGVNAGALIGKIGAESTDAFYIGTGNRIWITFPNTK